MSPGGPAEGGPGADRPIWHLTRDGVPASPEGEGFVHASFSDQLAGTLALHFADAERVVLLRLDPAALGQRLVLEPSRDDQLFPHIYGEIADEDVTDRRVLVRAADGCFDLSDVPGVP